MNKGNLDKTAGFWAQLREMKEKHDAEQELARNKDRVMELACTMPPRSMPDVRRSHLAEISSLLDKIGAK
jgi:hypothetical protein